MLGLWRGGCWQHIPVSFKLAGEGSLAVAAWDKLVGFYHLFLSGFLCL